MRQEPKAGRRIVSKGEYVKTQLEIAGLQTIGTAYLIVAGVSGFVAAFALIFLGIIMVAALTYGNGVSPFALPLLVLLVLGGVIAYACGMLYQRSMQKLYTIGSVTLLTRANTADLPAPDSLVRASQEPMQAQEGMLLRGASGEVQAGQGQEQEGQLLRASVGGQE